MQTKALVSWKTTTLGFIGGLMLLLGQVQAVLDDDPDTNLSLDEVIAALALIGIGAAARDNNKSSQDVGVRR